MYLWQWLSQSYSFRLISIFLFPGIDYFFLFVNGDVYSPRPQGSFMPMVFSCFWCCHMLLPKKTKLCLRPSSDRLFIVAKELSKLANLLILKEGNLAFATIEIITTGVLNKCKNIRYLMVLWYCLLILKTNLLPKSSLRTQILTNQVSLCLHPLLKLTCNHIISLQLSRLFEKPCQYWFRQGI